MPNVVKPDGRQGSRALAERETAHNLLIAALAPVVQRVDIHRMEYVGKTCCTVVIQKLYRTDEGKSVLIIDLCRILPKASDSNGITLALLDSDLSSE